jgi:hypothetical protein
VYQLLLNARSASALNQVAPGNAFELPNHWFVRRSFLAGFFWQLPLLFGFTALLGLKHASRVSALLSVVTILFANLKDAMDPTTMQPDHNGGKPTSDGGPGGSSLCAGTSFYQDMKATMLEFWRTVKLSAVDQDGSRCMNT